jgi:Elongation factor Tu domain 2
MNIEGIMKFIWLTLCAAVLGLSAYPNSVELNGVTLDFNQFWRSDAVPSRICQAILIISLLGLIRDLLKYRGRVASRLVKRSFINIGFLVALYVPWVLLGSELSIYAQIGLSVLGALIWVLPFVTLMVDGMSVSSTQHQPSQKTTKQTSASGKTEKVKPVAESPADTWAKFANLMADGAGRDRPFEVAGEVDESLERTYDSLKDFKFLLQVEDVFDIKGRGTVVTGLVSRGQIRVNQSVEIHGFLRKRVANVNGIEKSRKLINSARQGERVGIILQGVSPSEIRLAEYIVA